MLIYFGYKVTYSVIKSMLVNYTHANNTVNMDMEPEHLWQIMKWTKKH